MEKLKDYFFSHRHLYIYIYSFKLYCGIPHVRASVEGKGMLLYKYDLTAGPWKVLRISDAESVYSVK